MYVPDPRDQRERQREWQKLQRLLRTPKSGGTSIEATKSVNEKPKTASLKPSMRDTSRPRTI